MRGKSEKFNEVAGFGSLCSFRSRALDGRLQIRARSYASAGFDDDSGQV
jgi:hypothetical protein